MDAVDKDLIELAELYGIEVTDGKESVIIMEDGTEKLVSECSKEEIMNVFGLKFN